MGCWGVGPLDNDVALAWLQTIRNVAEVRRAVDSDDHDVALAACGVVAWAAGWPLPEDPLECNRPERDQLVAMRRPAARRCERLMADDGALYALWADSDALESWLDSMRSLVAVLGTIAAEHTALRAALTTPEQVRVFEDALDGLDGTPKQQRMAKQALASLMDALGS